MKLAIRIQIDQLFPHSSIATVALRMVISAGESSNIVLCSSPIVRLVYIPFAVTYTRSFNSVLESVSVNVSSKNQEFGTLQISPPKKYKMCFRVFRKVTFI